MKEINDIKIFMYGENPNRFTISESEIIDFNKFKGVPIIQNLGLDDNECNGEMAEKVIGLVIEATRIDFPYVYGNIKVEDYITYSTFKNYEIQCEISDNNELLNIKILSIELE